MGTVTSVGDDVMQSLLLFEDCSAENNIAIAQLSRLGPGESCLRAVLWWGSRALARDSQGGRSSGAKVAGTKHDHNAVNGALSRMLQDLKWT